MQSLQEELSAGRLRSTQLVEEYQRSICMYNGWLGADQLAPDAMDRARETDSMRLAGKPLGPLHGIPILIKVRSLEIPRGKRKLR